MLVTSIRDREHEVRRLVLRAWFGAVVGNTTAAAMVGVVLGVSARIYVGDIPNAQLMQAYLRIGVPSYAVVLPATFIAGNWAIRRRMRWFLEGRPATSPELERFAALPRLVASANTIAWAAATTAQLVFFVHVEQYSLAGWALPKAVAVYGLGYIVGTALAYLLMEQAFRPYLRLILPADVADWPPSMGLRARLLVAWFAVAGAPLLLVAFSLVALTPAQRDVAGPALRVTSVVAAGVGLIAFVIAGRTITLPLETLQRAFRRVGVGDLTTRVEIEEAGEIGHLEAGFNQMVDALQVQLEEVQASRTRIVEAADAERARIERNLHDGAQQRLLSLSFALRAVERTIREGGSADVDMRAAIDELNAAMSELRELARGIHPAILEEEGLGPALGSLAERAPVPTEVTTRLPARLPPGIEVTAYFVVAESLANVARYADAARVSIEAVVENDALRVHIADDGKGGADARQGSGLRGLSDRVAALGGELTVDSPTAGGTRITAVIPCA